MQTKFHCLMLHKRNFSSWVMVLMVKLIHSSSDERNFSANQRRAYTSWRSTVHHILSTYSQCNIIRHPLYRKRTLIKNIIGNKSFWRSSIIIFRDIQEKQGGQFFYIPCGCSLLPHSSLCHILAVSVIQQSPIILLEGEGNLITIFFAEIPIFLFI